MATAPRTPTSAGPVPASRWRTVELVEPTPSGYLLVGLTSGAWPLPPAPPRRRRRALLEQLHRVGETLRGRPGVLRATVLRGAIRAPGTQDAPTDPHPLAPAYDAVLLVETAEVETARTLAGLSAIAALVADRPGSLLMTGRNIRRIGPVDVTRPGVFLLNFFSGPDVPATLDSWQHTAGWFQDETGLRTSEVIEPDPGTPFTLVNYARWDHFRDVMPSLLFKPSFRSFVLAWFRRNGVAPHPLLYVLDRSRV